MQLTTDRPDIATVPSVVNVSGGHHCAIVRAPLTNVAAPTTVTFTISGGTGPKSGSALVRPAHPIVYTQSISRAGGQSKVTVCKADPADPNPIQLTSSNPAVFPVPDSVFPIYPATCISFVVQVGSVSEDTSVTITAISGSPPVTRTGSTIVRNLDPVQTATPSVTETTFPTMTAIATDTPVPTDTATSESTATETETQVPIATQSPTQVLP